jgi:hypothetical protein
MARVDVLPPVESDLLIARNEALADVNQLCVVLVIDGAERTESIVDCEGLQAQVIEKLKTAEIEHIDCQTGLTPRLRIQIETVLLSDCGQCVYRIQTALSRIVTFTDHRELQVRADVWQLKPVMKTAAEPNVAQAITEAVLIQADVYAGAYQAARRLQTYTAKAGQEHTAVQRTAQQSPMPVSGPDLYVASKNSSVFHRADCRMARNISEGNLVTYNSRDEAIAAGKRPCKTCNP